ncbi:hypothetical protein [Micromonospora carbonacea]|uniref:hypothetical protein n=1 Tax=Micromonospora carbonacea TaxID=47853 RepID=UPI0033C16A7E
MTDLFDAPATGAKITSFENCLLLITPTGTQDGINTAFGPADATVVDLVVLDGPSAGQEHPGVLVFQKALQGQLRPKVGTGRMVLGRLGRGVAKPGQSAPWILGDPTEQDKQAARTHLAKTVQPPF